MYGCSIRWRICWVAGGALGSVPGADTYSSFGATFDVTATMGLRGPCWPPEATCCILAPMPEITARLSTALADRYKIERHLRAKA